MRAIAGAVAAVLILGPAVTAQDGPTLVDDQSVFPFHGFLASGYGSAGYDASFLDGATPNQFSASLSPVLLFQIRDRFLFNVTVGAGKFLLPFNVFSERLHPTWINKMTGPPAI